MQTVSVGGSLETARDPIYSLMVSKITVAACQPYYIHKNTESAFEVIHRRAVEAEKAGASLICFPECFFQGYVLDDEASEVAIDLRTEQFLKLMKALGSLKLTIVLGLIEREGLSIFITAVVIRAGVLIGFYRKNQLVGKEADVFTAGSQFPLFELQNTMFGINICYDLNFPDCASSLANQGAKLLVCPSNNMLRRPVAEEWKGKHNVSRSQRARENGVWLLSADVTGEHQDKISYGPTALINPRGEVVEQLPLEAEGLLIAEIF